MARDTLPRWTRSVLWKAETVREVVADYSATYMHFSTANFAATAKSLPATTISFWKTRKKAAHELSGTATELEGKT